MINMKKILTFFNKILRIGLHENVVREYRVDAYGRTDMRKLTGTFLQCANKAAQTRQELTVQSNIEAPSCNH